MSFKLKKWNKVNVDVNVKKTERKWMQKKIAYKILIHTVVNVASFEKYYR